MVWAQVSDDGRRKREISLFRTNVVPQIFPFVALQFFRDNTTITMFLVGSFSLWLILNIVFFCSIDLSYANTFFGTKTAPQYTCEYYSTSEEDFQRWDAVFENRIEYSKNVHTFVLDWVAANIVRWQNEKPGWFKIEKIPDKLMPTDVFEAAGSASRPRSSSSGREFVGINHDGANDNRVFPTS